MPDINVAFVGDTHGEIIPMYHYLESLERRVGMKFDAVVQVGDFGMYLPSAEELKDKQIQTAGFEIRTSFPKLWNREYFVPIPTWVIAGNHEDYEVVAQLIKYPDLIPNFHLLPDGEITDVLGLRVGAIWGNFSNRSWANPERVQNARVSNPSSRKSLHIYKPSVEKLAATGQMDVLITHDAPHGMLPFIGTEMDVTLKGKLGLDEDEPTARGCPGFTQLYETGCPEVHFFGHFHLNRTMRRNNPRVVCLHSFNQNAPASVEVRQYSIPGGTDDEPAPRTYASDKATAADAAS